MIRTTIWHLSDLHATISKGNYSIEYKMGKKGRSDHLKNWLNDIEGALQWFKDNHSMPEWIICSGDLATFDQEKETDLALQFLEDLAELVDLPSKKIVVVPGNHDVELRTGRIDLFNKKVKEKKFSSPVNPPLPHDSTSGVLPIPLDTTGLIGPASDVPKGFQGKLRQMLCKQFGVSNISPYIRAGLIDDKDIGRIGRVVNKLKKKHKLTYLPIVVCHHPISAPATEIADFDIQDTTVLAPLLRRRLLERGVSMVLQGHKHEMVSHSEKVFAESGLVGEMHYITAPSMYGKMGFVCLNIFRSDKGDVAYANIHNITRTVVSNPGTFSNTKSFHIKIPINQKVHCSKIQKVVTLNSDMIYGKSRVDFYHFGVNLSGGSIDIPFKLNAFGGLFGSEFEGDIVGYSGSQCPRLTILPPPGDFLGKDKAEIKLKVTGKNQIFSSALSVSAVGVHACDDAEGAMIHGTACNDWSWESTDFYCNLATDMYECIVRFPKEVQMPTSDQIRVEVFDGYELDSHQDPGLPRIEGLPCEEGAEISVWRRGRRLIVRVPDPMPGFTYRVSWKLPTYEQDATDKILAKFSTQFIQPFKKSLIYSWDEVENIRNPGIKGAAQKKINYFAPFFARSLQRSSDLTIKEMSRYDVVVLAPSHDILSRKTDACTHQVISAVTAGTEVNMSHWDQKNKYGTGMVGYSHRNLAVSGKSKYVHTAHEEGKFEFISEGEFPYEIAVGVPMPIRENAGLEPKCAFVVIIGLREGEDLLRIQDKDIIAKVALAAYQLNSYIGDVGEIPFRVDYKLLGFEIREADQKSKGAKS